jgi:hypothetical protein
MGMLLCLGDDGVGVPLSFDALLQIGDKFSIFLFWFKEIILSLLFLFLMFTNAVNIIIF